MSVILTAVGAPDSDNWREEMPIWAHMIWWRLRHEYPSLRRSKILSYVANGDHGCIVSEVSVISIDRYGKW